MESNETKKRGFTLCFEDKMAKIYGCSELKTHFQMNIFLVSMIERTIHHTEIDFSDYDDRYDFALLQTDLIKISYIINHSEEIFNYFEKLVENDPERKVTVDQIFKHVSKLIFNSYYY